MGRGKLWKLYWTTQNYYIQLVYLYGIYTPPSKHIDLETDGYVREIWEDGKWKVIREELMFKDYYDGVIKEKAIKLGINGNKL